MKGYAKYFAVPLGALLLLALRLLAGAARGPLPPVLVEAASPPGAPAAGDPSEGRLARLLEASTVASGVARPARPDEAPARGSASWTGPRTPGRPGPRRAASSSSAIGASSPRPPPPTAAPATPPGPRPVPGLSGRPSTSPGSRMPRPTPPRPSPDGRPRKAGAGSSAGPASSSNASPTPASSSCDGGRSWPRTSSSSVPVPGWTPRPPSSPDASSSAGRGVARVRNPSFRPASPSSRRARPSRRPRACREPSPSPGGSPAPGSGAWPSIRWAATPPGGSSRPPSCPDSPRARPSTNPSTATPVSVGSGPRSGGASWKRPWTKAEMGTGRPIGYTCGMRAGTKLAILAATAALVLGSCEFWDALWSGDPAQDRVSYPDEALSLVGLEEAAYSRAVSRAVGARAGLAPPGGASLTLVAEIDPPLGADGQPLQASHVFLQPNGKYALVSYMTRGAEVGGALDLVDVTSEPRRPRIVDTMRFPDFDVAVVCEGGGTIYLGGQLRDQGAYVKTLGFRGDSLEEAGTLTKLWHGAAFATDLALVGNATLYVTTGADGAGSGVYKLAASNLEIQTSQLSGFPDARSLAATSDEVFVYDAGTGAPDSRLARLDSALALTGQNDSLDAYPALDEAKSKLALGKNGAGLYLALNKSGLLVLDPATLAIRTRLPAPVIGGIDSDKLSTNAAAFGFARSKDILLVANGEGGLWVGDAAALAAASTDDAARASLSGTIRFGPGESVNYADAKSGTIVVASGLGGVKVVLME